MYIQDLFIKYYDFRPFKNNTIGNKVIGNFSKILVYIANIILPIWFKCFPGKQNKRNKIPINISMTSFPNRINKVWLVIECMLRQTKQPTKIKLYLSKEQFPSNKQLPNNLSKYILQGFLDVILVNNDIKSHKKYWYIINENPYQKFITIDDDIIYLSDTIENLWNKSQENTNCIISCYNHKIKRDKTNQILPYTQWGNEFIKINEKGNDIFFGSGGGTLFPAGSLLNANQPVEILQKVCPYADDIWLNAYIRKNGYMVMNIRNCYSVPEWLIWKNIKLSSTNNGEKLNDKQLTQTILFFKEKYNLNPFT